MSTVNNSVEEAFIFTQKFGKNPNFTVKTPNFFYLFIFDI